MAHTLAIQMFQLTILNWVNQFVKVELSTIFQRAQHCSFASRAEIVKCIANLLENLKETFRRFDSSKPSEPIRWTRLRRSSPFLIFGHQTFGLNFIKSQYTKNEFCLSMSCRRDPTLMKIWFFQGIFEVLCKRCFPFWRWSMKIDAESSEEKTLRRSVGFPPLTHNGWISMFSSVSECQLRMR